MSKQTEALKLALEALEYISSHYMSLPKIGCMALAAVEEALAEQPAQQQEPVATMWQHGETGRTRITMPGDITDCDARWFKVSDLYTSPQPRKPWVRLSTDEIYDMYNEPRSDAEMVEFARAIEAKLREKNQ